MDDSRARELLVAERVRVTDLLAAALSATADDRSVTDEVGDYADPAPSLVAEGIDDAVATQLQDRLHALDRAQRRLEDGTFGRSVRSGQPISDERLEADIAAELTVTEAAAEP